MRDFLILVLIISAGLVNLTEGSQTSDVITERLAKDSEGMEGVVGAREAEELVDASLRKYEGKQVAAEKSAQLAEQASRLSFKEYDDALKNAAERAAEKRHLETKLKIVQASEENDAKIAGKADSIARKMAALAAKADAQLKKVQLEKQKTQGLYDQVISKAKVAENEEAMSHAKRKQAELEAQQASATVAHIDLKITQLLDRRSRLKDLAAAEDKKASSSLAEAFKEDATRQEKFRESLIREKEVEQQHMKQEALVRLQAKVRAQHRLEEAKAAIAQRAEEDVKALAALDHQVWRQTPELHHLAFAAPTATNSASDPKGVYASAPVAQVSAAHPRRSASQPPLAEGPEVAAAVEQPAEGEFETAEEVPQAAEEGKSATGAAADAVGAEGAVDDESVSAQDFWTGPDGTRLREEAQAALAATDGTPAASSTVGARAGATRLATTDGVEPSVERLPSASSSDGRRNEAESPEAAEPLEFNGDDASAEAPQAENTSQESSGDDMGEDAANSSDGGMGAAVAKAAAAPEDVAAATANAAAAREEADRRAAEWAYIEDRATAAAAARLRGFAGADDASDDPAGEDAEDAAPPQPLPAVAAANVPVQRRSSTKMASSQQSSAAAAPVPGVAGAVGRSDLEAWRGNLAPSPAGRSQRVVTGGRTDDLGRRLEGLLSERPSLRDLGWLPPRQAEAGRGDEEFDFVVPASRAARMAAPPAHRRW